jgi:hypothetical protein
MLDRSLLPDKDNRFSPQLKQQVDVSYTDTPLAVILTDVLAKNGLTYSIQGGVILIQSQDQGSDLLSPGKRP